MQRFRFLSVWIVLGILSAGVFLTTVFSTIHSSHSVLASEATPTPAPIDMSNSQVPLAVEVVSSVEIIGKRVVRKGDTLWSIACDITGNHEPMNPDERLGVQLTAASMQKLEHGRWTPIRDPRKIFPGDIVGLPVRTSRLVNK